MHLSPSNSAAEVGLEEPSAVQVQFSAGFCLLKF